MLRCQLGVKKRQFGHQSGTVTHRRLSQGLFTVIRIVFAKSVVSPLYPEQPILSARPITSEKC